VKVESVDDRIHLQQVSESTLAAIDPRLGSNAAAIILDEFIIAIDAGVHPDGARLFRATLEETYRRPVRFTCMTHFHCDHTFGLRSFRDTTLFASSRIVGNLRQHPDWTLELIAMFKAQDPEGSGWLDEVGLIKPSVLFDKRLVISNNKSVEFRHCGGHTSCSIYGYFADEKVLFAGDLVVVGGFPYAGDATVDPEAWMSTLRSWLDMDIDRVVPGHGPVSGVGEISRQLEMLETLKRNTLAAIEAGGDHTDIVVPPEYTVVMDESWFLEKTTQRWHAYYRGGAGHDL
jgi:cyclase